MARLLVVDDDTKVLRSIQKQFHSEDLEVEITQTGRHAVELVRQFRPSVVILNVRLADMAGLDVIDCIRAIDSRLPVIAMTAHSAAETAIEAMKSGAFDYLHQPIDRHQLRAVLERALALDRLRRVPAVSDVEMPSAELELMVGRSPEMQEVCKAIGRVAPSDVTVLIVGESGTGKELVARALHHHSGRKEFPFLAINCAALPEMLLESELFGHERGAFTGAERRRLGKFEQADRGTLLLDEVGDMSLATQAKVLRLLQEQRFERLGGNDAIQTDVRLIAATNKDLYKEMAAGRFRKDLLYRLNVFVIRVPPLRERRQDIPLLIEHYLPIFGRRLERHIQAVTPETLECLCAYAWPGNVRQLQSVLKYAIIQSAGDVLTPECLPENLRSGSASLGARQPTPEACMAGIADFTEDLLRGGELDIYRRIGLEMDRVVLSAVLRHVGGNQVKASAMLGISRTTLRGKLRALKLGMEQMLMEREDGPG
jgi:two-component system nitrogen regulation response regulator GlnG